MKRDIPETQVEKFVDDVLSVLLEPCTVNGESVQGNSISHLMSEMKFKGWKGFGNLNDFRDTLEFQGFRVVDGKGRRGTKMNVVCL